MEQRSSLNSTPVIPRSHSHKTNHSATPPPHNSFRGVPNLPNHPMVRGSELTPQHPVGPSTVSQLPVHTVVNQAPVFTDPNRRDAIIPSLDVLRRIATVTDSVNINVPPQMRWPNEGFHASNGKKWIVYNDLSFPHWVSGQLTNIYNIQDPNLVKQALLQVIMATRDAASLPWPVVKNTWAVSMHEVEEGSLDWSQTTQWSLNRLSASQLAMTNVSTTQPKKLCKFYNEGSCSHEGKHGNDTHACSFCSKQGTNLVHPELKCSFKVRASNRQNVNNSN